jgi:hypothetical protein
MWRQQMSKSKLERLLLAALMVVAPFLYSFIQGYWAIALVPIGQFLSVSGKVPWAILIISLDFLGALSAALLLALPLGYVAKERPYLYGALLSFAPLGLMLWVLESEGGATTFLRTIDTFEYLSVLATFMIVARLGAYLRSRRQKPHNTSFHATPQTARRG